MPRRKRGVARFLHELADPEWRELMIGSGHSHFRDDAERGVAWEIHRAKLMQEARPGTRPLGWWRYDCPRPWGSWVWERSGEPCKPVHQAVELIAMGVVDDEERAQIEAEWRRQDIEAHGMARTASAVNGIAFDTALAINRELRGVPTDRPVLEDDQEGGV